MMADFAPVRFEQIQKRAKGFALGPHRVLEVGAVKAGDEVLRFAQAELGDDVLAHALGGRGGQRDKGHMRQAAPQVAEVAIFRAEIVPPFGDAMRFIHGDEADLEWLQKISEPRQRQSFRGDVQNFEHALLREGLNPAHFGVGQGAVDERRFNAVGFQGINLVFHEGDQRGDDQRQSVEPQRGQLIAQRLAPARGHDHQRVPALHHAGDDLFLKRQKIVIAEVVF